MHVTLYATTTPKQRQKVFDLFSRHTSVTWSGGDKPHPKDFSYITRDMTLTFDGIDLAVRLGLPSHPRQQTELQDIVRAVRDIYPVGSGKRGKRSNNTADNNNATNSRQSTQKVLF